jgi:hypothetical protein
MSAAADKRIAAIREKMREERALLPELNKQIGADLKKQIRPALPGHRGASGRRAQNDGVGGQI